MTHRILDHLDEDLVTHLQNLLYPLVAPAVVGLDIAGIQHAVLGLPEVDEGSLHTGQNVADLPQVDVPGEALLVAPGDIVLHEHCAFQNDDLSLVGRPPDQHLFPLGRWWSDDLRLLTRRPAARLAAPGTVLALALLGLRGLIYFENTPNLNGAAGYPLCLALLDRGVANPPAHHLSATLAKQCHEKSPSNPWRGVLDPDVDHPGSEERK